MLCTVVEIYGDYAWIKYDGSEVIAQFALALLPFDIDIGSRLKYENYEFTMI